MATRPRKDSNHATDRRAMKALRASEERFRMLADNMSQLAWTCDLLGNVTWYNKRWLEYTGLTFEEMKGWGWQRVQHPDHIERVVARVQQSAVTGEPWEDTFPLRGRDGQYRWFLSRALPIHDEQGNLVQWFGTNTDVTDQKRAEEQVARQAQELQALNERLTELDRLKSEFFSNVSHEFRTPLTLMLSPVAEMLEAPAQQLTPETRALLAVVRRNGLRLQKLLNALLDFSRIEAGRLEAHYEPTDLATLTADLASNFRSAVEKGGVCLTIHCPPLSGLVHVDQEMWEKVVLNLLSNALKFTFAGEIAVRLRQEDGEVVLTVSDTGTGMAPEELPHIFERFHRVRGARARTYEGAGIGLALVQELVKLHGGRIEVQSVPDEGSTFTVRIPMGVAHLPADRITAPRGLTATAERAQGHVTEALGWLQEPARPASGTADAAAAPTRARILLADDNADMRAYITRLLETRWQVDAVADGEDALRTAEAHPPDLVVADVMMPRLDGFELLRALRSASPTQHVPVILLSARAGEEATLEGIAAGADDYIVKPFTARDFVGRVEAQLARAGMRAAAETQRVQLYELFMQAPTPICVLRGRELTFEMANPLYLRVAGRDHLVGRTLLEAFPEFEGQGYDDMLRDVMGTGVPRQGEESLLRLDRRGDGLVEDTYWTFVYAPLCNADGVVDRVMAFCHEVTDQVRARQQVEALAAKAKEGEERAGRLYRELEEANRVKDEFLATLSHELRTPLNAMLGWSQMLRAGTLKPDVQARAIASLERNAKAQAQLVDDLLDVSRIMAGKLSIRSGIVDLGTVVAGAVDTIRPTAAAHGVHLHVDFGGGDAILVTGDEDRLRQIVWNLLSNAVKFTPRGGRADVSLRRVDSTAEVVVADTGEGIEPAFLTHVFERFRQGDSTTARKHGGLGLGLSLVRHLAEAHGGSVTVESAGRDQGATFTLRLPIRTEAALDGAARVSAARSPSAALAGVYALVVDDELDARDLARIILEAAGARVATAGSTGEALHVLSRSVFDVVIADIGMPDRDGYALIQTIRDLPRERGGEVPAIAVTAYASLRDREQALRAGFDWHLAKPIEPEQLVATVGSAIAARRRSASYGSRAASMGADLSANSGLPAAGEP